MTDEQKPATRPALAEQVKASAKTLDSTANTVRAEVRKHALRAIVLAAFAGIFLTEFFGWKPACFVVGGLAAVSLAASWWLARTEDVPSE